MEEQKINKIKNILADFGLELLILFGSYESNSFNENSDLDLAVKVKTVEQLKKDQLDILNKISTLFNQIPVDMVLLNHADPLIKFKIASEGKLLYQAEKGLFEKFQVRAASEHNDARKLSEHQIVDQKFAEEIAPSAGLRNRLVHEYEEIDDEIVYKSIQRTINSYKKYIRKIEKYLKNIENSSH